MTKRRQDLGREGEQRAARYLEERGYRIVARNVRADRVELDLVARQGPRLVFVEVKTRRSGGEAGAPGHAVAAEAVDARKQARLRRGARAWLDAHPEARRGVARLRFDVVTCVCRDGVRHQPPSDGAASTSERAENGPGTGWSIEHWEAAF